MEARHRQRASAVGATSPARLLVAESFVTCQHTTRCLGTLPYHHLQAGSREIACGVHELMCMSCPRSVLWKEGSYNDGYLCQDLRT